MLFRSFCALADGAASPVNSSIKFFREEYEEHVRLGRCPMQEGPAEPPLAGWDRPGEGAPRRVVGRSAVPVSEVLE